MILENNIPNYRDLDKLNCVCDFCNKEFKRTYKNIKKSRKTLLSLDKDYCASCASKLSIRPQRTKEYWDENRKQKHGIDVKNSNVYKKGIQNRDSSKQNNGMYNKKHSTETKIKMSNSRKFKIGSNATAWKGGVNSLTKRVKGYIHRNINWYFNVYKRDGYKCIWCHNSEKIEAHHIVPLVTLIRKLLKASNISFANDDERYLWLIQQPEIVDVTLSNGITLCRECHKKAHNNWGSKIKP